MSPHLEVTWKRLLDKARTDMALVSVEKGKATIAFNNGDRIVFDAQRLVAEVEYQLLRDKRQGVS